MTDGKATADTSLVLMVNDEEWATRAIESILKPEGYAVLMAYTGAQALELASKIRPDLILVDLRLPDVTGIDLCARLRRLPTVRDSTPILLYTAGSVDMKVRMQAFRAGAWGLLRHPINPQELLAQLRPYVAAKRDVDAALAASDLDPSTGFYNMQGLLRRGREMTADVGRSQRPLACVVLGPSRPRSEADIDADPDADSDPIAEDEREAEVSRTLGQILLSLTRISDAVGRSGSSDFVILAPGTDQSGAQQLAERITRAVEQGAAAGEDQLLGIHLKAGLYAVSGTEPDTVIPEELLRRASAALQAARSEGNGKRVYPFGESDE